MHFKEKTYQIIMLRYELKQRRKKKDDKGKFFEVKDHYNINRVRRLCSLTVFK